MPNEEQAVTAPTEAPVEAPVEVQLVDVQVKVPKETLELAMGLVKMMIVTREALANGFQIGQDLPVIMVEAMKELPQAVGGFDKLDDEFKADKGKVVVALSIALDELL